jgi:hypothetical protein
MTRTRPIARIALTLVLGIPAWAAPARAQAPPGWTLEEVREVACGLVRYSVNRPAFEGGATPLLVIDDRPVGRIQPSWLEECSDELPVWRRVGGFQFVLSEFAVREFGEPGEDGAFLILVKGDRQPNRIHGEGSRGHGSRVCGIDAGTGWGSGLFGSAFGVAAMWAIRTARPDDLLDRAVRPLVSAGRAAFP